MMKRMLALCACFLALALPARAVTVIQPKDGDMAARLDAAKRAIRDRQLGHYGMTPVGGDAIADGTYAVGIESTSPFFRIASAALTADGGELSAEIAIGSLSYGYVYMGTAAQAEADEAGWIAGAQSDGVTAFAIPVPALNQAFDCAAYSLNRGRWYDRQLLVDAATLPKGALAFELPDYGLIERAVSAYDAGGAAEEAAEAGPGTPEPVAVDLPDGEYAIEVNLAGGSGRASVSSPTMLIVRGGGAWARLLWSSAYYDYMRVGGARYENLAADGGNSTFEIPIAAMDAPMAVIADTTAMGEPVEIEYQLTFYSESIGDRSQVPQEAAKQVLVISLAIIAAGGVLNHFVKKGRR